MNKFSNVILIGAWPPPSGGVASYTQDLYYNLLNKKIIVKVYAKGDFQIKDKNINHINLSLKHPFKTFLSLLKIFREIPFKAIVHTQSFLTARPNIFLCIYFLIFKQLKHIYLVETLHDGTLPDRYNSFTNYQRLLYSFIDKILDKLIVTNETLNKFCANIGISSSKIVTINSFLPINYIKVNDNNISSEYQKFIERFPFTVSTVGAFIPDYDLKTIVEAFLLFSQKYPKSGLIILETAFIENTEYRNRVLKNIEGVSNILIFKNLPRDKFFGILSRTKLFIRGCINDSFGLSKVEAILMGANVITAKTGTMKFMTLYEYQNTDSLFSAMLKTILNINKKTQDGETYYRQLAYNNLDRILNIYNIPIDK